MKRVLAVLAVAGLVVGGGAAAYATTKSDGTATNPRRQAVKALTPAQRTALRDCVKKARTDHEGDAKATRDAVKTCLTQAGIDVTRPARGLKAVRGQVKALPADKRAALKTCVKAARTDHKGDRPAVRVAVRACLATAGITVPGPGA
jgi:uncharacterized membrane protein